MIHGPDPSRWNASVSRSIRTAVRAFRVLGAFLTLSLGHDAIWPQRTLSVCIERGRLSFIYGSRFLSRINVKGALVYPFDDDKYPVPESMALSLKLAAEELHASLGNVVLVVPKSWVIMQTVELPSAVKENLPSAVSFELDRFTPLAADDALYDFYEVAESREKLTIFLAASRADLVNPYLKVLEEHGVRVGRVVAGASAMGTCCGYLLGSENAVFAEVHPDRFEGGVFIERRMVAAMSDVVYGDSPEDRLKAARVGMTALTTAAANGTATVEAAMIRDPAVTQDVVRRCMDQTTILNGIDRRKLHMKEKTPELSLAESGSVIEALWPKAKGIDLLAKGNRKKSRSPVTLTVLFLAAIAAMAVVYVVAPLNIEQRRLAEIERQVRAMKSPVKQVEALKKEIEAQEKENAAIENFKKDRRLTVDILREITNLLPKSVWLTRARITETTVDLEGYAGSAAEILPKLEGSPYLKKVEFASPTFRDTRLNADRFVIKMEIENQNKPDAGSMKGGIKK